MAVVDRDIMDRVEFTKVCRSGTGDKGTISNLQNGKEPLIQIMALMLCYRVSIQIEFDVTNLDGDCCKKAQCIGAVSVGMTSGIFDGIGGEPMI